MKWYVREDGGEKGERGERGERESVRLV